MQKASLTEAEIISKFILTPVMQLGWEDMTRIRQEVKLRDGKAAERGPNGGTQKGQVNRYRALGLSLAVIEAKANKHEIGKGMQQGLDYARLLDVTLEFASNHDDFIPVNLLPTGVLQPRAYQQQQRHPALRRKKTIREGKIQSE